MTEALLCDPRVACKAYLTYALRRKLAHIKLAAAICLVSVAFVGVI